MSDDEISLKAIFKIVMRMEATLDEIARRGCSKGEGMVEELRIEVKKDVKGAHKRIDGQRNWFGAAIGIGATLAAWLGITK